MKPTKMVSLEDDFYFSFFKLGSFFVSIPPLIFFAVREDNVTDFLVVAVKV